MWSSSALDSEEPPGPWNTLEFVFASILEVDARAGNEINDGSREKYFSRLSKSLDSRGRVHGNATDVIPTAHDFSRMEPDA